MSAGGSPRKLESVTGAGLLLSDEPLDDRRALAVAYSHYLAACCRRFMELSDELPGELRPLHGRVAAHVRLALTRDRRSMLACFASPTVSTPLQCVKLRCELVTFQERIDRAAAEMLVHLGFEMVLRQLIGEGEALTVSGRARPLASLSIGGEILPPAEASGWRFSADSIAALAGEREIGRLPASLPALRSALEERHGGFRFAPRYWPTGVARFATLDHNPIAEFEAHPEKAGNHVDLGGRSVADWIGVLDQSFALVERFLPGEHAEMKIMLHEIIPVGTDDERHLSASYLEAVGTIYLTLHPNVMTMTEALIHEFQHNKLNVAAYSVEYLCNPFHPLYKSPVRPDPRPLWGILLAVHAFLPVAELYRRMREGGHPWSARPDFERRLSEIDLKNHEGMEMLRRHADLTPAGRALFADLEALESRHLADRSARGLATNPTEIHLA